MRKYKSISIPTAAYSISSDVPPEENTPVRPPIFDLGRGRFWLSWVLSSAKNGQPKSSSDLCNRGFRDWLDEKMVIVRERLRGCGGHICPRTRIDA